MKTINAVLAVVVLALGATQLSCSVNDYCLNCGTDDDAGTGSGDGDANDGGGSGDGDANDGGDTCVPTGTETCNGKDDDCDGQVDNGVLPEVGEQCANQLGECAGGTKVCDGGAIKCTKNPSPEICDFLDNNCNGTADENDPGGGGKCGTEVGECVAGTYHCRAVAGCDPSGTCTGSNCCVKCEGFIDNRLEDEECNGLDDNCNGVLDEGLTNMGPCTWPGATDEGQCMIGTLACQGGAPTCIGAVFPQFEQCNQLDDDCNGDVDEIFNTDIDPLNCKACGVVCATASKTCVNATNAGATCLTVSDCAGTNPLKACAINSQPRCTPGAGGGCSFQCNIGFIDLDTQAANGCEYRCTPTGNEECDGVDNDCDGLVDTADPDLMAPAICLSGGECGATAPAATCSGMGGWTCTYPGVVQFPETLCDNLNNDCDANIDENQPNLDDSCSEVPETACTGTVDDDNDGNLNDGCPAMGPPETGAECNDTLDNDGDGRFNDGCPAVAERGICQAQGTYECNPANLDGPAICVIETPGQQADAFETCDDQDNDCDGKVDERTGMMDLVGEEWVDIGGGVEIMKYEASRRDATSTQQGNKSGEIAGVIVAAPTGATQSGSTATFNTTTPHGLTVGTKVRISGVSVAGYNGLVTVATVATATRFTATLPVTGLGASGGGTVLRILGACSKPDAMPWTNVTYPEALAVCEAMGASLCPETTWHQACGSVTPNTLPIAINGGTSATSGTLIEAEDYFRNFFAGGPETACNDTVDNDGDGIVNDGCPSRGIGIGPETGAQCANALDDDGDGRANDGCPAVVSGTGPETACDDAVDDDGDGRVNDGCPVQQGGAETICTGTSNNDEDNDGRANDGCPAYEQGAETVCGGTSNNDEDDDGRANDGCPAVGTPESGNQCNNNQDDDGDGADNDGCPAVIVGAGPETGNQCNNNQDDDDDGRDNDGCPAVAHGIGPESNCTNATDDDLDGFINDGCATFEETGETGAQCNNLVDDDGDGVVNDGCPEHQGGAETGAQCTNAIDDDTDGFLNDGCPEVGPASWVEDYTPAPNQHSGIGNMRAVPNTGVNVSQAQTFANAPRMVYQISIPSMQTDWRISLRLFSAGNGDNTVHIGFSSSPTTAPGTMQTLTTGSNGAWTWVQSAATTLSAGTQYLHVMMAEDGMKVDAIFIARGTTPQPPCQNGASAMECANEISPPGNTWSYATMPTTYQAMVCNGADRTTANDNILATGTLTSCYADHDGAGASAKHVFDMSGNVKEWTLARSPGENPIRGGASNDTATGISCGLNFNLANDAFFFPNVGFRCCR